MFCTYAHYTPQGTLFYIGKGSNERRPHYLQGRNNYWNKVVAKYGKPKVEVLAKWQTEVEAFEHEKLLISCFRDLGFKLCNLTDGGDGTSGYKQTPEHREKNRLAGLGNKRALGHKVSEESKKLMSKSSKGMGVGETNSQYGTCWITKDGINKKIKKEDLETYLNEGWLKGRKINKIR